MGNNPVKTVRSRSLSMPAETPTLTKEHEKLLVQTWQGIRGDLERIGLLMFTGLFDQHPETKKYFGLPGMPITEQDKQNMIRVREHGLRFMNVVRDLLTHIAEKNRPKVEQTLRELGRRHLSYEADVNLIDVFGQQFIMSIKPTLSKSWDRKIEDAWINLFRYIAFMMKQGMLDAIAESVSQNIESTQYGSHGSSRKRTNSSQI
ncbi:neuroglobin-like [Glandiceps talaboti]